MTEEEFKDMKYYYNNVEKKPWKVELLEKLYEHSGRKASNEWLENSCDNFPGYVHFMNDGEDEKLSYYDAAKKVTFPSDYDSERTYALMGHEGERLTIDDALVYPSSDEED